MKCICPKGFRRDPIDPKKCNFVKAMVPYNDFGMESVPAGEAMSEADAFPKIRRDTTM